MSCRWKPPELPKVGIYEHEHRAEQCRGKMPYKTRREAKLAKRHLRRVFGRPFSVYFCAYCCRYHLTSRRIGGGAKRKK